VITDKLNAHYILILKGNQPLAWDAARTLLTGTGTEFEVPTTVEDDRGHARSNLGVNTFRLDGRANIAHARRDSTTTTRFAGYGTWLAVINRCSGTTPGPCARVGCQSSIDNVVSQRLN
jgi:hypothetical protein